MIDITDAVRFILRTVAVAAVSPELWPPGL
jgi:hypothetical protein